MHCLSVDRVMLYQKTEMPGKREGEKKKQILQTSGLHQIQPHMGDE